MGCSLSKTSIQETKAKKRNIQRQKILPIPQKKLSEDLAKNNQKFRTMGNEKLFKKVKIKHINKI